MKVDEPNYIGAPSAVAALSEPRLGLIASALSLGTPEPGYIGTPGGGAGGSSSSAPRLIKQITFIVLSPQLAMPSAPVAKSQPIVIASPEGAKSYSLASTLIGFPATTTGGAVPPVPSAMPVGIDQPPKADLLGASQVEITVSWALLPGSKSSDAGTLKALFTIEFYG